MARERREYRCSFCGKPQEKVRRLIAGPNGVFICDECVALCSEIIAEEEPRGTISDQGGGRRTTTSHKDGAP